MIRLNSLLAALIFASGSALAAAPVSTDIFLGKYALIQSKEGFCDTSMIVDQSVNSVGSIDLHVGNFSFVKVNEGKQVINDELVKLTWNAYTTANSEVVESRELITKTSGSTSVQKTSVKLNGETLTVKSKTTLKYPSEAAFSFGFHCVYKKTESAF